MIDLDKFVIIEKELSEEYGSFDLFALFLREDAADKWDILVASSWLHENKQRAMKLITDKLQEKLPKKELIKISQVAFIEKDNPALDVFHDSVYIEHGIKEVKDSNYFGHEIEHAFIITSKRREQSTHT